VGETADVVARCPAPHLFPSLDALVQAAWDAHQTPPRHYHAWSHVLALVTAAQDVLPHLQQPAELWAALVFHDAVYVAGRTDNETASAALAVAQLQRHRANVDTARTAALIGLTAQHGATRRLRGDDAWMMDLDTGVLGASAHAYDRYAAGVRAEYAPVVAAWKYNVGRAGFLTRMLNQPRLFHTDHFEERLGPTARANLARERAALPAYARFLAR
jgi:predicted metal-dependent HD superfamily phosphohydrolase